MFSRKAEVEEPVSPAVGDMSIIQDGLVFTGNTVTTGKLHIEGEIQGDINCVLLSIGKTGRVNGAVTAEEVVISGSFTGSITAASVTLKPGSHVDGDVTYNSLEIEHGAHYEGKSKRTEKPIPGPEKAKGPQAAKPTSGEASNGKAKQPTPIGARQQTK